MQEWASELDRFESLQGSGSRLAVDYDLLSSSPEVTQLNLMSAHLSITCGLRDDECQRRLRPLAKGLLLAVARHVAVDYW